MARTLGILKKTSLEGLAEGWGDECYVLTTPVTYGQLSELNKLKIDAADEAKGIEFMIKFIKEHIAGGKVKVLEGNDLQVVDLEADDVDGFSIEMTNTVFASITGAQFSDPKVSAQEAQSTTLQSETEPPTTTP